MKKKLLTYALAATFFTSLFIPQFAFAQATRIWATYYGGSDAIGTCVATDAASNVYLAGYTNSPIAIASGGFDTILLAGYNAFLVKFDANGNRLWATYYGDIETGFLGYSVNIATDAWGNVYLAGQTSDTTGIASGGFQNIYGGSVNGGYNAFLVKFDANGNRLWATYYGGTGDAFSTGVATDVSGNVYLEGMAQNNTTNIASSGGFDTISGGQWQCFLAKFDSAGNRLWGTYYGGGYTTGNTSGYYGNNVATDATGNVYMTGMTQDTSGIASPGGFLNTYGGGRKLECLPCKI